MVLEVKLCIITQNTVNYGQIIFVEIQDGGWPPFRKSLNCHEMPTDFKISKIKNGAILKSRLLTITPQQTVRFPSNFVLYSTEKGASKGEITVSVFKNSLWHGGRDIDGCQNLQLAYLIDVNDPEHYLEYNNRPIHMTRRDNTLSIVVTKFNSRYI